MPKKRKRNYRKEYDDYYGSRYSRTPLQEKHNREKANRNKAHAEFFGRGKHNDQGFDVDHKDGNALNNSRKNLHLMKVRENRGRKAVSQNKR